MHDAAQGSSCLPNQNLESLRTGRCAGVIDAHTCGRVGRIPLRGLRWPGTDMNYIGDRIPLAKELADLLLVDFKQQRNLVIALGGLSVYGVSAILYIVALRRIPLHQGEPGEPHWMNDYFPAFDAIALYGYIATRQPRRSCSRIDGRYTARIVKSLRRFTRCTRCMQRHEPLSARAATQRHAGLSRAAAG